MTNIAEANPYAHLGPGKRVAKAVLRGLHSALPESAYSAIYHPAFDVYHRWQRHTYAKRIPLLRRRGDADAVARAERVHAVMPHSLIGAPGLEHTHDLAVDVIRRDVPGAFVECGVARGGCAALLATVAATDTAPRNCWFFDSYEGLPDPTADDLANGQTGDHIRPLPKGSCLGTYEQVEELLFDTFGLSRDHITMVKGWFQDTLPVSSEAVGAIAVLRVDGDWYDSTKCCLETLFDQVSPGGHVIIDDYFSCFGARRATDEFIAVRQLDVSLTPDGRGGCSFRKSLATDAARTPEAVEAA